MEFTLENLGNGAVQEQFDHVLQQVLANIEDPNTDWKAPRSITLVVKLLPNEDRGQGKMVVTVTPTLAPIKPFSNAVMFGRIEGKPAAREVDRLFPDPKPGAGDKKPYILNKGGTTE
ncbi:MAG: hypothetical protein A4E61_00560 [Syntrophorhabdus sp. PtaB.Bin184]|nr:MAG: hypothetical protein A4E61_00560 [Syntrophorhabdus sp. PtaB.Bin184]